MVLNFNKQVSVYFTGDESEYLISSLKGSEKLVDQKERSGKKITNSYSDILFKIGHKESKEKYLTTNITKEVPNNF